MHRMCHTEPLLGTVPYGGAVFILTARRVGKVPIHLLYTNITLYRNYLCTDTGILSIWRGESTSKGT